jgi:hypothetical protein
MMTLIMTSMINTRDKKIKARCTKANHEDIAETNWQIKKEGTGWLGYFCITSLSDLLKLSTL